MSESNHYDLTVIGAGPGGYVCAIRAAQLGLKTALIEKSSYLGGTCLNIGCIPSKALLHSTEIFHQVDKHGDTHGIKHKSLEADVGALMRHKDKVVAQLRGGVSQITGKRGIDVLEGKASLLGGGKISVEGKETQTIESKHIVIATGSVPVELPALPFDGESIVSSDQAIAFPEAPKRLVVVGGGAIGLELGSVWSRLGSKVTVIEFLPQVAAGCDVDISKQLARALSKQGLKIDIKTSVTGASVGKSGIKVSAERNGKSVDYEADKVLVSVGRKPYTEGLGLDKAGVKQDDRGRVIVDEHWKSSADGIYAIGDVITGPMLAHKAEDEGVAVAEVIAGKAGHVNYDAVPNVIYTSPEVATVGIGEDVAKEKDIEVNVGKFPVAANGRAIASGATEGMVKVIACKQTDRLLGVQAVAHNASEIIATAVSHMEYGGSAEDLARTMMPHPTVSETLKEAAMAVDKRSIHSL